MAKKKSTKSQNNVMLHFIAQMCEYAQDHLDFKELCEYDRKVALECTSYAVACFLAQNTDDGHNGVERDIIIDKLVSKPRSHTKWYEIIDKLANKHFGGWKLPTLEVVVRVSGGVVQSAIANAPIAVDVFDVDNRENFTDKEIEKEWKNLKKTHPIGVL